MRLTGAAFYAVQAAFAVRIVAGGLYGETSAVWFAFDAAGTLFYCLLCIVSAFAFFHSKASLHDCDLRQTRTYAGLLMLLTTAIAGAYFASNLAVTWIFLEATTLCSAGIVYHRRTAQALEAAWKYVFVCSTGIAMAYLGILLLAAATDCESLDYATVAAAAPGGGALYLKTAFLLILCGYSCKAELFPLYTVGVDANFAAPAPASALISTGLVNAGFLALLRVYKLLAATEVFPWVKSVLAARRRAVAGGRRAVPAPHQQLQTLPLLLHGREHGHRGHRAGHQGASGSGPPCSTSSAIRSSRATCSSRSPSCGRSTATTASTASATTSTSTAWGPWDCSRGWSCWWPSRPRRCSSPS